MLARRLLIADDKSANRELLRTLLETLDYEITEAENGIEAVRLAKEHNPELIILDLHMPLLDGFGVLAELRRDERFRTTPIMALTASALQGDREHALNSGFDSYVTKPVPMTELLQEVQKLLGSLA